MDRNINKFLQELEINSLSTAHNVRCDGICLSRNSSDFVHIKAKENEEGLIINVDDNANEMFEIPVIINTSNYNEFIYNDFNIGENVNITIFSGCMINNNEKENSMHNGFHTFNIGKNSKVTYIENHLANGENENKVINTKTVINLAKNSELVMKTKQLKGLNKSNKNIVVYLEDNSSFVLNEKILLAKEENTSSNYVVNLNGKNSSTTINSKTVAKDNSISNFTSTINGNNKCFGHVTCDALLLNDAKVSSNPMVISNNENAILTHEAAIGKIAEEQIEKLMTLGLTKKEAEDTIINSYTN